MLTGNRVYNGGTGILVDAPDGAVVVNNVIYSNVTGVSVSSNSTLKNNLIYADSQTGVYINSNAVVTNNTIDETGGSISAVVLTGSALRVSLDSNIVVALAGVGITVADAAQAGFSSNYNLFQTGAGGRIGNWLGVDRTTLAAWRTAAGRDKNSQFGDPDFVDADGADGVLGYGSPTATGQDDDFHVQTLDGSFHGGSLAVVLDPATGLLSIPGGMLTTTDTALSPAVDGGDPSLPIGAETAPERRDRRGRRVRRDGAGLT